MQPLSIMYIKRKNRTLRIILSTYYCLKYPFLRFYTRKNKLVHDCTWLDCMPTGWRKSFGLQMCKEIKEALLRESKERLKNYHIDDIKEKYGSLRWYDSGGNVETNKIIYKYEQISWHTCINCGRPASVITQGWICPYCDDCVPKDRIYRNFGLKNYPFYGWTGNINHRENWDELVKESEENDKY